MSVQSVLVLLDKTEELQPRLLMYDVLQIHLCAGECLKGHTNLDIGYAVGFTAAVF